MKSLPEPNSKRPASTLTNRLNNHTSKSTLSNKDTFSSKREDAYAGKKVEDLKAMYKKLTAKAILFNFERGNLEEVERDLKRLQKAASASNNTTELFLIDLYMAIHESRRGINSAKNFLLHINKCIAKINKIDLNYEIAFDDSDRSLFEKIVFKEMRISMQEIFSNEKTFRSFLPPILENFQNFLSNLLTKDHFLSFVYFFIILFCTKKNQKKSKEQFIKLFKEKSSINEHTMIDNKVNSISSSSESDLFCIAIKDIVNRIENSVLVKGDQKKSSRKSIFKSVDLFCLQNSSSPSPRRKFEKNKSKNGNKDSNYHKYLKNLKSIKIRESLTPTPTAIKEKVKSSKQSHELRFSKTSSSKPSKPAEKDDSSSTNPFSSSNALSCGNKYPSKGIIKIVDFGSAINLHERANQEVNEKYKSCPLDNMVSLIGRIDNKLNEMGTQIRSFADHIDDLRMFLSEN